MPADPETGLCGLGARYCVAMLPRMQAITTVWLVKPEAPQDAESVAVMRRAIEKDGAREGSLIGECLDAARARGLSGEETYVFLAYQALLRLEETHERHIYLSDIAPFLESVPRPGVTAHKAPHIAAPGQVSRQSTACGRRQVLDPRAHALQFNVVISSR